jgi:hypothetical protein
MDHTVLLDQPAVSLAAGDVVVEGVRYPAADIHSARVVRMPAAATGPILMIGVGVICFFAVGGEAGILGPILGAALIAGAIAWWIGKKPAYQVTLGTAEGEISPFESRDEATARRVLDAIEQARAAASRAG